MSFPQQVSEHLHHRLLALLGLGAIAPGYIAFATGVTNPTPIDIASGAEQPVIQSLQTTATAQTTASATTLPFIGTRFVNFSGGTGTVESIEIEADGTTRVGLIGLYGSQLLYSGPFSNPIMLNDGRGLLIEGNQALQLFADEPTIRSCRVEQNPCTAALQKPFADNTGN